MAKNCSGVEVVYIVWANYVGHYGGLHKNIYGLCRIIMGCVRIRMGCVRIMFAD